MAFLLAAPPFSYSEGMIGLFGLAGAAGALGARPAGGFADKGKSHLTTTFGLLLLLLSWLAIWLGHTSVLALIIGILVLDLTVQGVHITNQTVIYRLHRMRVTGSPRLYDQLLYRWRRGVADFRLRLATCRLGRRLSGGCHGSLT